MRKLSSHLVLFIFSILVILQVTYALQEFQVHKLVQYTKDEKTLGSQRASFNLFATFPSETVENPHRRMLILQLSELRNRINNYVEPTSVSNETSEFIEPFQREIFGDVGGALIIISESELGTFENDWEVELLSNKYTIPVYFIKDSEELQSIIKSAKMYDSVTMPSSVSDVASWILSDSYQLSLSSTEPYALKPIPTITNIQALIGSPSAASTIVIFGHYDTFAASVGFAKGAKSATSSSALLELLRLFNNLVNGSKLQTKYNFLFILSNGNYLNYVGSKYWVQSLEEKVSKSIEFVICLDSLLSNTAEEPLFLYSSRPTKDPVAQKLYSSFSATAEQFHIKFEVVVKKVNLLNTEEEWEHEHFSKEKILASTISSSSSPSSLFGRASVNDKNDVDVELLSRNIRFVAESLGRYIFDSQSNTLSIFEGSLSVNQMFVSSWVNTLLNEVRVTPYMQDDLINNLENTIAGFTSEVSRTTFPISQFSFFTLPTTTTMTVSLVKPFVFDVALAIVLFSYLYVLYLFLKYTGSSILD